MKIFKDMHRRINIQSLQNAMLGLNEAPELMDWPSRSKTGEGRNRRRCRKHRKVRNAIAAESRRRNRC